MQKMSPGPILIERPGHSPLSMDPAPLHIISAGGMYKETDAVALHIHQVPAVPKVVPGALHGQILPSLQKIWVD